MFLGATHHRHRLRQGAALSALAVVLVAGGSTLTDRQADAASETDAAPQEADISQLFTLDTGWTRADDDFRQPPPGMEPGPVSAPKDHPYVMRGLDKNGRDLSNTQRVADISNPNLKPWVAEALAKVNALALKDETPLTAMSTCWPAGVPLILEFNEPMFFVKSPKEVTIIYQRDHHVRHVFLNAPHSKTVKPSWYGESVGHFEKNELVIDTIGLSDKTFLDLYNTPHTDQEHVVERYSVIDGGKTLHVVFSVDDPGAFNAKWSSQMHYKRAKARLIESICAENNVDQFTGKLFPIPIAEKPDF